MPGAAITHCLFEGIGNEPGMKGGADAPAGDASGTGADERAMGRPLARETMARGAMGEAFPAGDANENVIHWLGPMAPRWATPQHARGRPPESALGAVQRALAVLSSFAVCRGSCLNTNSLHHTGARAAGEAETRAEQVHQDPPARCLPRRARCFPALAINEAGPSR